MIRRVLWIVSLLLIAVGFLVCRPLPTHPLAPNDVVIVLLTPGMTLTDWQNPTEAPTLARMASQSPLAVMPTRAAGHDTDRLRDACRTIAQGTRSAVFAPGALTLGATLRSRAVHIVVIADDAGAATALVGQSADTTEDPPVWRVETRTFPESVTTDPSLFAAAVMGAVTNGTPKKTLVVADYDDFYRVDRYAPLALPSATAAQRRDALRRFDRLVALLRQTPATLFIVSPVAARAAEADGERLAPLLIGNGPKGDGNGFLTSPSTRQTPGLIANTDVAATIATLLGLPPEACRIGAGRPAAALAATVPHRDDVLRANVATWAAQARAQRSLIYVPWCLAAVLLLAAFLSGERGVRVSALGTALAIGATAFPLLLLLGSAAVIPLPSAPPNLVYGIAVLGCAGLTAFLCTAPGRRSIRTVLFGTAAATALIYLTDAVLGGPLNAAGTPLSYAVTEAARFYGIGNEVEGLLIGAALLAALEAKMGRGPLLIFGAAVAVIVGHPFFGADAGALIGLGVGFGTAAVLLRRAEKDSPSPRRLLAEIAVLGAAALVLLLIYGLWEGARSANSRSHVGEAVAAARTHGFGVLTDIAARKMAMNAHLTVSSPWAALLAGEVALTALLWYRHKAHLSASDRTLLVSLCAAAFALYLFNDSGVVAAATCLLWVVPALVVSTANDKGENFPIEILPS